MKKIIILLIAALVSLNPSYLLKAGYNRTVPLSPGSGEYNDVMKQDILCLMMAYPGYITDIKRQQDGYVYLTVKSGNKVVYDDKRKKEIEQKLLSPDIQDTMEQIYPLVFTGKLMEEDYDPGRGRVYALLHEVYGGSRSQIESNLINVKIGYQNLVFNNKNGAAEALKKVMQELAPLAQKRQDIRVCMFPSSGTYNYRYIEGTGRLSPHAFGIAIDLARDKRDYWKWATRKEGQKRLEVYPAEIPAVFEKYGFIWGGKWGHFDILHYEYRPEIILKARYFGKRPNEGNWYSGVPYEEAKDNIEKINKAFL